MSLSNLVWLKSRTSRPRNDFQSSGFKVTENAQQNDNCAESNFRPEVEGRKAGSFDAVEKFLNSP